MQRWQELGKERRSVGSFGLRSDLPGGVRKRNKSKEKKTPRVLDLHLGGGNPQGWEARVEAKQGRIQTRHSLDEVGILVQEPAESSDGTLRQG